MFPCKFLVENFRYFSVPHKQEHTKAAKANEFATAHLNIQVLRSSGVDYDKHLARGHFPCPFAWATVGEPEVYNFLAHEER